MAYGNEKSIGVAYSYQNIYGAGQLYSSEYLGYTTVAQGSVTQATDKSTAVTLNKSAGTITMNNAQLNATTSVSFTLNNTYISANDTVILTIRNSVSTAGSYTAWVTGLGTGTATITVRNITGGNLSDAVVLNFALIHAE